MANLTVTFGRFPRTSDHYILGVLVQRAVPDITPAGDAGGCSTRLGTSIGLWNALIALTARNESAGGVAAL